jgi:hypothetical protein
MLFVATESVSIREIRGFCLLVTREQFKTVFSHTDFHGLSFVLQSVSIREIRGLFVLSISCQQHSLGNSSRSLRCSRNNDWRREWIVAIVSPDRSC